MSYIRSYVLCSSALDIFSRNFRVSIGIFLQVIFLEIASIPQILSAIIIFFIHILITITILIIITIIIEISSMDFIEMLIDFFLSVCKKVAFEAVTFFTLRANDSIATWYSLCENIAVWTISQSLCFIFLPVILIIIHLPLLVFCTSFSNMDVITSVDAIVIPFCYSEKV